MTSPIKLNKQELAYKKNLKLKNFRPSYFYITSKNVYLDINGKEFTDDMFIEYDREEKLWKESEHRMSFQELMKIFPEAIVPARKGLKAKIKEFKSYLKDINKRQNEYYDNVIKSAKFNEQNILKEESDKFFNEKRNYWNSKIKTTIFCLSHLDELEGKVIQNKNSNITDADIKRAKEVLIESLFIGKLQKHGKLSVGNCPFHKDKTPSFTIYRDQNSFWCYSCQTGGSVVDYVMKRDGVDFLSAIKKLIHA